MEAGLIKRIVIFASGGHDGGLPVRLFGDGSGKRWAAAACESDGASSVICVRLPQDAVEEVFAEAGTPYHIYPARRGGYEIVTWFCQPLVQSVSTPACHAGGRRFESVPGRQIKSIYGAVEAENSAQYASVAQLGRAED